MRRFLCGVSAFSLCLLLSACAHEHTWQEATCTTPKTCTECNEIEGEVLEHVWTDATCIDAKTCSLCGETDGEPLGHELTEANYQQPATCNVCGTTEGEPLQAIYEEWGIDKYAAELDKTYDFEMSCYETDKSTLAKITFTNYKTFESDDTHPAKEGYEWKSMVVKVVIGDENAYEYGASYDDWYDTYYCYIENEPYDRFSINYNGKIYTDCEVYFRPAEWGEWKDEPQFGWDETCTFEKTIDILAPIGYDGFIYGACDAQSNFWDSDLKDTDPSDYLYFRFK